LALLNDYITENSQFNAIGVDRLPETIPDRTRRIYDALSSVYALSTFFFHSKAHRLALELSGVRNRMRVLEVATGSGEMFHRLVEANLDGHTIGVDLSPKMAARAQRLVARAFAGSRVHCEAVDARFMPYRDESFDAVVCCYLFELLGPDDITRTLRELNRVLRRQGRLTVVSVGQFDRTFNQLYQIAGRIAPALWGRQVESRLPEYLESTRFKIIDSERVWQGFYPSRVFAAQK
jgi:ubiquinone/menaquinone biosynthesis C-methylase UbiE